ncbi:VOC family protein [Nakamurella endophytica]|uniref:Glyoxalase n=1 Tax=Nakamurella endophytica TaxID=1748367 RepID=A0A917T8J0_9ACTN|nr:VOC family protein [Nakamurella endophytica]GGM14473.1 glyoxalase [Nakamurella endophytica]
MHRVLLRETVIDVPAAELTEAARFWAEALAAQARPVAAHREFVALDHPAALSVIGLQGLASGPARLHLDLETDDVEAEVRRLVGLGARELRRHRSWVVLGDPSGIEFCVVPAESPDFAERARTVS